MQFFDLPNSADKELTLVQPAARWIDDMLQTCQHPIGWGDASTLWTRDRLNDFINQHPGGREHGDIFMGRCPSYYFWMRLLPEHNPVVPMAGTISFRISDSVQIRRYAGHIGYGVFPPARGNHYAERATRLLLPLAKLHGMDHLWITCNPDNIPSRRTCENLGCQLIEIVDIPPGNPFYERGERQKCRYYLKL